MRSKSIFVFFVVVFLVSCASPAPQPTVTVVPSSTHTAAPTSTETPEPTPTAPIDQNGEDGEQGGEVAEEVSDMGEFDYAWVWEKGKSVQVEDFYEAGSTTLTVEDIKSNETGKDLVYKDAIFLRGETLQRPGYRTSSMSLQNLTLEKASLVKVDLADNTDITDGYFLIWQLGTFVSGQQVSFTMVIDGSTVFGDIYPEDLFSRYNVGQTIDLISGSFVLDANVHEAVVANPLNRLGDNVADKPRLLFELLGKGYEAMNADKIIGIIKEGGVLENGRFDVGNVDQFP